MTAVDPEDIDPEDVVVLIRHSWGDIEASLTKWMEVGPGPRPGTRPIAEGRIASPWS
jgi:hypothetical protein